MFTVNSAAYNNTVGFWNVIFRVGQLIGKITVVGQKQQALAILIQAPYGIQTNPFLRNKICHTLTTLLITHGSNIAAGLIKHQRNLIAGNRLDHLAVYANKILCTVSLITQLHGTTVEGNSPLLDHCLRRTAGTNTAIGNILLNSD